jgi:diguanylate cyclase (GGDEF)-like protein
MYRVLSCLAIEHDYRLVVLAVLVCVATTLTTFMMYAIACASRDGRKLGWAALTGVCAGAGIWATHFVAMLAYQGSLPTYYEPVATLASLLIAIGLAACGFSLAVSGRLWLAALGGIAIGSAIGTMHYVGMDALSIPGRLDWDPTLIAASWVFGIAFAALAMLAFHLRTGPWAILSAGGLLTLAICTLHFTAMGAATVVPDPTILFVAEGFNRSHMALAVVGVTFIVLMSGTAAVLIQRANDRCESTLREQNSHFESVLRYLPVGLSLFDRNRRLVMCNRAYAGLYGLSEELIRPGTSFSEIVLDRLKREEGGNARTRIDKARSWMADHFSKLDSGRVFTETFRLKDGRTILKRIGPLADGGWVDVEEDITAVRESDEKFEWLAHHDVMTGIANRLQFRERLERQLESYDPRLGFALHWIDLDNFKNVNDDFGHPVGDALLKSVASRLATSLRAGDVVGRLGGDEFAVLQVDVGRKDLAEAYANRILQSINQSHDALGHKFTATASIGIALAPDHGETPDELFASADVALYRAKGDGRGVAVVYTPGDSGGVAPNPLRAELIGAAERDELILHYQPMVDLRSGAVSCFEALMRWKHPSRGVIPPSEFVPLAEETRQIVPMGRWALERACADATGWPQATNVSVNISAVQIENCDIYEAVAGALEKTGLAPHRLQIEITETVLMRDQEHTQEALRQLNNLGVTITLDDFGACFATLSYLRSFPFKKIKIDRSFVRDVPAHHDCVAIVRSVADLARELNMHSVAEGVETASELAAVREAGYDEAQGFYFSLPVPAHGIAQAMSQCASRFATAQRRRTKAAA